MFKVDTKYPLACAVAAFTILVTCEWVVELIAGML